VPPSSAGGNPLANGEFTQERNSTEKRKHRFAVRTSLSAPSHVNICGEVPFCAQPLVLGGIRCVVRSGASWRVIPVQYSTWEMAYKRYRHWCDTGFRRKLIAAVWPVISTGAVSQPTQQGNLRDVDCETTFAIPEPGQS
jgi:transposase